MGCARAVRLLIVGLSVGVVLAAAPVSARRGHGGSDWPFETRLRIEEGLVWTGYYDGRIDGRLGSAVRRSIKAFQRDAGTRASGELSEETLDRLSERARAAKAKVGFALHADARTGIRLGLPLVLAPYVGRTERGSRFASRDGRVEIELFRFPPGRGNFDSLYDRARAGHRPGSGHPDRRVTYSPKHENWFVVSGIEGTRRFYTRARRTSAGVAAFAIAYDEATAGVVEPIIVAMSSSFADPRMMEAGWAPPNETYDRARAAGEAPSDVVPATTGASSEDRASVPPASRPIAAAFAVSQDGDFLTGAGVMACRGLTLGERGPVTISAVDRRNGLALLKAETARDAEPISFGEGPIEIGDDVTAATPRGESDSQGYVSTGRVVDLAGSDGDTTRLTVSLPARADDGGAPLFDAQGTVVGIMVAMPPNAVGSNVAEQKGTRSALRRDMAVMFLAAHGLVAPAPAADGARTSDAAEKARRATLSVRCTGEPPSSAGDPITTSTIR